MSIRATLALKPHYHAMALRWDPGWQGHDAALSDTRATGRPRAALDGIVWPSCTIPDGERVLVEALLGED